MSHPLDIELHIGGMTCASCAARVEKKLNRMPGVQASVNYATEKATVALPDGTTAAQAIATVEATGYTAHLPKTLAPTSGDPTSDNPTTDDEAARNEPRDDRDVAALRHRLLISAVLALPVVLLAMIRPLQFDNWQWVSLALAAPVVGWGAWPFHRAASTNARHGAASMDTLISLGVLAPSAGRCMPCYWATPATPRCGWRSSCSPAEAPARSRSTWRWRRR